MLKLLVKQYLINFYLKSLLKTLQISSQSLRVLVGNQMQVLSYLFHQKASDTSMLMKSTKVALLLAKCKDKQVLIRSIGSLMDGQRAKATITLKVQLFVTMVRESMILDKFFWSTKNSLSCSKVLSSKTVIATQLFINILSMKMSHKITKNSMIIPTTKLNTILRLSAPILSKTSPNNLIGGFLVLKEE